MLGTSVSFQSPVSDHRISVEQALRYLHQGWSVIPVMLRYEKNGTISKRPAVKWQLYQQRLPTEAEMRGWFGKERFTGIGVVTGQISGIVVVDIEHTAMAEETEAIESPLESQTISGGRHLFYRWTKPIRNTVRLNGKPIDFRGDGGFIVLPPSRIGNSGYSWIKQASSQSLPCLPLWIEQLVSNSPNQVAVLTADNSATQGKSRGGAFPFPAAVQGQRNATAAHVAGILCANILPKLWESVAWPRLIQWNAQQCHPSLSVSELRSVWNSITAIQQRHYPNQVEKIDQQEKSSQRVTILPWKQFCTQAFQEPEWIVEQLIPKKGLVAVAGPPESCKSYFTSYVAITVARGDKLFDRFVTKQVPVLLVDQENLPVWIQRRFQQFRAEHELPLHIYTNRDYTFNLEDDRAFEQVLEYIARHQIGLLVLDTLRLSHSRDENSSTDMKPVIDRLKRLTQHTAVIFIQHHRKVDRHNRTTLHGEDMMGSMLIRGSVDYQLSIIKLSDTANTATHVQVSQTKARYTRNMAPFQLVLKETVSGLELVYCDTSEQLVSKLDHARQAICELLAGNSHKRRDVIEHLVSKCVCSARTAEAALAALITSGAIMRSDTKPRVYTLVSATFPPVTEIPASHAEPPQPLREKSLPQSGLESAAANHVELSNTVPHSATSYIEMSIAEHNLSEREKPHPIAEQVTVSRTDVPSTKKQQTAYSTPSVLTTHQLKQQINSLKQWLLAHEKVAIERRHTSKVKQYDLHLWQARLSTYCVLIDEAQKRHVVGEDDWLEMARMIFHADDGTTGKWLLPVNGMH